MPNWPTTTHVSSGRNRNARRHDHDDFRRLHPECHPARATDLEHRLHLAAAQAKGQQHNQRQQQGHRAADQQRLGVKKSLHAKDKVERLGNDLLGRQQLHRRLGVFISPAQDRGGFRVGRNDDDGGDGEGRLDAMRMVKDDVLIGDFLKRHARPR